MPISKKLLCGACIAALSISAASAGKLVGSVDDVNPDAACTGQTPDQMDDNHGCAGGQGSGNENLQEDTNEVTVEDHFVMSPNRIYNADKPMLAHVELLIYDTSGLPTLSGDAPYQFDIDLDGPVWKAAISAPELVRAGNDGIYSEAAEGLNGNTTQIGNDDYTMFLTFDEGSEESFGVILPVKWEECVDESTVEVVLELSTTDNRRQIFTTTDVDQSDTDIKIASCADEPSFYSTVLTYDLTVDVGDSDDFYEEFEELVDKGVNTVNMIEFGLVTLGINHDVFDPKQKDLDNGDATTNSLRYADVADIEYFVLAFEFEDGDGIEELQLIDNGSVCGVLEREPGTDIFSVELDNAGVIDCFGLDDDAEAGESQDGEAILKIVSSEDAPIADQKVALSTHKIIMDNDQANTDDDQMWQDEVVFTLPEGLDPDDMFRIFRSGLAFGPFDWTTGASRAVASAFRLSGFPADNPVAQTGYLISENSIDGSQNGRCFFDLSGELASGGETIIDGNDFDALVGDATCLREVIVGGEVTYVEEALTSVNNRYRGDVTWTINCGVDTCDKADVDRLLINNDNGTLADYGDNGNDGNSIKARSCDPGRFGPHVGNDLTVLQAQILTFLCSNNATF